MIYLKNTIFVILILLFSAVAISISFNSSITTNNFNYDIIIDAGHGLPDGGAVGVDGTLESDLNLQFANKLYKVLTKSGFKCKMIRTDQNSIYTQGNSIHAKKVSDIRNRVEIAKKHKSALVISIHMNTFPSADVCGAQVFYSNNNSRSKDIAFEIQNVINQNFNNNKKVEKPIASNVYFFNNIPNDCVLIECGFLTNQNDLDKLKDESFQNDFVNAISEAITYKIIGG